jgi:hypothetical protein
MSNKIDDMLEEFISEVSENYTEDSDVEELFRNSMNKILTKKKQGIGHVLKTQVMFEIEEDMALPIFPSEEMYDED